MQEKGPGDTHLGAEKQGGGRGKGVTRIRAKPGDSLLIRKKIMGRNGPEEIKPAKKKEGGIDGTGVTKKSRGKEKHRSSQSL